MPDFVYKAIDASGDSITGRRTASSREALVTQLERQNLTVVYVEEMEERGRSLLKSVSGIGGGRARINTLELAVFCKQLASMLQGGVPILRAINTIAEEVENKKFKATLRSIGRDLGEGVMFSESLKKYPEAFIPLFIAMIETGEKVGSMVKMLFRLSVYLESIYKFTKKIRSAINYPLFVFGFFICAMGFITLFILPKFKSLYEEFDAELPALTNAIFNISTFIINHIFFVAAGCIISFFSIFFFVKHTRRGRLLSEKMIFKIPLFGKIIRKTITTRFCKTLSTLLDQGVAVTEALLLAGRTSNSLTIEEASREASVLVMEGETIPTALARVGVFPPLMLQMATVGAESGSLPELLEKTSEIYEAEIDIFVGMLMTYIEPILIITLGAMVGVAIVALYLPLFKMGLIMKF